MAAKKDGVVAERGRERGGGVRGNCCSAGGEERNPWGIGGKKTSSFTFGSCFGSSISSTNRFLKWWAQTLNGKFYEC